MQEVARVTLPGLTQREGQVQVEASFPNSQKSTVSKKQPYVTTINSAKDSLEKNPGLWGLANKCHPDAYEKVYTAPSKNSTAKFNPTSRGSCRKTHRSLFLFLSPNPPERKNYPVGKRAKIPEFQTLPQIPQDH